MKILNILNGNRSELREVLQEVVEATHEFEELNPYYYMEQYDVDPKAFIDEPKYIDNDKTVYCNGVPIETDSDGYVLEC